MVDGCALPCSPAALSEGSPRSRAALLRADVLFFPCNRSMIDSFKAYNAGVLLMAVSHQFPDYAKMVRGACSPAVRPGSSFD